MENIASFTINHLLLEPGVYVSRIDRDPETGAVATTFDLRVTAPNREPVMDTSVMHAMEHLVATYLRNDPVWGPRMIYFGPMGCRTGFYVVFFGEWTAKKIVEPVRAAFEFVKGFEGEIPGAKPAECGNWHDSDLNMAKWWARRYVDETLANIDERHMTYPQ